MYQKREDLDILFRQVKPEYVLQKIEKILNAYGKNVILSKLEDFFDFEEYNHFAKLNLSQFSRSELELRYDAMGTVSCEELGYPLFRGLYQYADSVLVLHDGIPTVKLDQCLDWNDISSRLGQDIFTTAWLAWMDTRDRVDAKRYLEWPAVIATDDKRLNRMLEKGLAENHFHLHGSTQSFALSWVCMMNHPDYICKFFKDNFKENLNVSVSLGQMDNIGSWSDRIKYAALIRALLFSRCAGVSSAETVMEEYGRYMNLGRSRMIKDRVDIMRHMYGVEFRQIDGHRKCLDYAVSDSFYEVNCDNNNRILAGERSFLYQCFKRHFSNEFTSAETMLFYLYLVIKSNFRSEIVQVNGAYGFENFSAYQDRKSQFFEVFPEYMTEALRLSVCAGIKDNHLVSLEGRIMPKQTAKLMKQEINKLDRIIKFSFEKETENGENPPMESEPEKKVFYYVIHFPKKKFTSKEFDKSVDLRPRNHPTRRRAKKCAVALVGYLMQYDDKADRRVKGIDACSLEIGCRPETFATEFRYIRGSVRKDIRRGFSEIGITYHVGEDFLDIADGLRAIDETIRFLNLTKGDRLGHAIVLGIEPDSYYRLKRNIFWTKQDYLDNAVWLLYRSAELNVEIARSDREMLRDQAEQLIRELYIKNLDKRIFENTIGNILDLYFRSWKLRGDHPDLYKSGKYIKVDEYCVDPYRMHMLSDNDREFDRENEMISQFYYLYHFDKNTKGEGLKAKEFEAGDWYIRLMEDMQKAIRQELFRKGIAIECNPTSNLRIGTFRRHDRHPILTFNNFYLENDDSTPNMKVSINTDDLGVFDTSLVNEYALMFNAITKKRYEEGNYNDDAVYDYLNYIRKNGIEMAFKNLERTDY